MSYIKLNEVLEVTGLSKKALFNLVKKGRFPKPVRYWGRALVWEEKDFHIWMEELRFRREERKAEKELSKGRS